MNAKPFCALVLGAFVTVSSFNTRADAPAIKTDQGALEVIAEAERIRIDQLRMFDDYRAGMLTQEEHSAEFERFEELTRGLPLNGAAEHLFLKADTDVLEAFINEASYFALSAAIRSSLGYLEGDVERKDKALLRLLAEQSSYQKRLPDEFRYESTYPDEFGNLSQRLYYPIMQALSPQARGMVVEAVLTGREYQDLERQVRADYVDLEMNWLKIEIPLDRLQQLAEQDAETWMPLLVEISAREDRALLSERLLSLPEPNQLQALKKDPSLGSGVDLIRLGDWALQAEGSLDDRQIMDLIELAEHYASQAAFDWLSDHLLELDSKRLAGVPDYARVSLQINEVPVAGPDGQLGIARPVMIELIEKTDDLGMWADHLILLHRLAPRRARVFAESWVERARKDELSMDNCERAGVFAYDQLTGGQLGLERAFIGSRYGDWPCYSSITQWAVSFASRPLLDWVLDDMSRDDAAFIEYAGYLLNGTEDSPMYAYARYRVQNDPRWARVAEQFHERHGASADGHTLQ